MFTWDDPREIALSLKRSAEASTRRKAPPFQSAMSMLNFYINRAGKALPDQRRQTLDQAKAELRKLFRRELRTVARLGTQAGLDAATASISLAGLPRQRERGGVISPFMRNESASRTVFSFIVTP